MQRGLSRLCRDWGIVDYRYITIPPSRLRRATSLYTREAHGLAETQKRLPPRGKLAAKLTDEGDIRPLPFKASNTVGRCLLSSKKALFLTGFAPSSVTA